MGKYMRIGRRAFRNDWSSTIAVKHTMKEDIYGKKVKMDKELKGKKIKIYLPLMAGSPSETEGKYYTLTGRTFWMSSGTGDAYELTNGQWVIGEGFSVIDASGDSNGNENGIDPRIKELLNKATSLAIVNVQDGRPEARQIALNLIKSIRDNLGHDALNIMYKWMAKELGEHETERLFHEVE